MSDLSIFLLRFGDHAVCSVNECSYNRPRVLEMVVRVKVQILVCVCGFSVYCEIQRAITIEGGTWVQERPLAFHFRFGGELYVLINADEVFREFVDKILMDLHEGGGGGGGGGCANGLGFELLRVQVGYDRGHRRTHGRSMFLFVDVAFVREVCGVQAEGPQFSDAFAGEGVRLCNNGSLFNGSDGVRHRDTGKKCWHVIGDQLLAWWDIKVFDLVDKVTAVLYVCNAPSASHNRSKGGGGGGACRSWLFVVLLGGRGGDGFLSLEGGPINNMKIFNSFRNINWKSKINLWKNHTCVKFEWRL